MTDYYIDSTAAGANNGTSWTDAWNTGTQADWTNAATTASVLGDRIFVASNNDTNLTANLSFTANANHTKDNPLQVIVATSGTSVPVTDYGSAGNGELDGSAIYDINLAGNIHFYGLRIRNYDANSNYSNTLQFERCLFGLDNASTAESYVFNGAAELVLIDSDLAMSGQAHTILFSSDACHFRMYGGSVTTDANIAKIFSVGAFNGSIEFSGVDMTGINASTALVTSTASEGVSLRAINCKFPATMTTLYGSALSTLPPTSSLIASHGDPYRVTAQYRQGDLLEETTIRRAGGADTGSQTYSIKVESASTATRAAPLRHLLAVTNYGDLNGTTVKVHMASNTGTALQDDEIWIDVHAATSAGVYQDTSRNDLSATPATYTDESGSEDWRNGGSALTSYQEQSMSVSPAVTTTGLVYVYLCVAKDFTTTNNLYVCPKLDIA